MRNILIGKIEPTPSSSSEVLHSDLKWARVGHTLGTRCRSGLDSPTGSPVGLFARFSFPSTHSRFAHDRISNVDSEAPTRRQRREPPRRVEGAYCTATIAGRSPDAGIVTGGKPR